MGFVRYTRDRKSWRATVAKDGKRTISATFLVEMNSMEDGPSLVLANIPFRKGYPYQLGNEGDQSLVIKGLNVEPTEGMLWAVAVEWGEPDEEQDQQNPLARPPIFTYSHESFSRVVWKDIENKGILNSAKEYFDPPVEIDDNRPIITVQRNVRYFDATRAERFMDAVSSGSFLGFSPRTIKCQGISGQGPNFESDIEYWTETLEFAVRWDGWNLDILDQGRNKRDANGNLSPIFLKDENGNATIERVVDPVPLDGNGQELENPSPDTVRFMTKKVYREQNFSELGL